MVQLSRPFQVVLAAFVLFAIAWFALLHRPGSGSSSGSGSSNVVTSRPHASLRAGSSAAAARRAAGDTAPGAHANSSTGHATHVRSSSAHAVRVTHTTAPGGHAGVVVHTHASGAGHTRTVVHTHSAGPGAHRVATRTASATVAAPHKTAAAPRRAQPTPRAPTTPANGTSAPAMQATVASELKQGKVVLLLFWNPKSTSDSVVHKQVEIAARKLGRGVVVHTASAAQVGAFGSITRDIQVYQTPTLLIVNPKSQVTTVTGYTDAYALEQTIREARG
jgi:hypothetical protein